MSQENGRHRRLIENMADPYVYHRIITDGQGKPVDYQLLEVNSAFEEMAGLSREDILGKKVTELLPGIENFSFDWIGTFGKVALTGETVTFEAYIEPLKRYYKVTAYWEKNNYFSAVYHSITDKKRVQESEMRWQFALEGSGDGVWDWNAQTSEVFFSPQWKKMLGYEEHEVGSTLEEWDKRIHPEDRDRCYKDSEKHFRGKASVYQNEHRVLCKDGTYKWILDRGKVIQWSEDGKPLRIIGTHTDISHIKQAEENLQRSQMEKEMILNAISERIAYLDTDFKVIWANRVAAQSVNMKTEELIGKKCHEIWYQRRDVCSSCPIVKTYNTKQFQMGEVTTPDGHCWLMRGYPITSNNQELTGIIMAARDITEQKTAETSLRESEQRFRQLVELAPDAIFVQMEKKFVYLNQAAVKLFGGKSREEFTGMPVMDRFHPEYHHKISRRIEQLTREKKPAPWQEQVYLKLDGTPVDVEVSAVPIRFQAKDGALVYVRDITHKKKKEEEKLKELAILQQQQKLEAIGALASGVAHEINNPINGIMNYGQLILDNQQPGSSTAEYAGEIIEECKRVSTIVKNLLQFSRNEKQYHSLAQVEDIIQKTISLIGTILRKDQIRLEVNIPWDLPDLKCRSQQIQQVIMNLLTNARDALNNKYPGYHEDKIIRVNCHVFTKDNRRCIRIMVEDYGTGIPEHVQEKIFEPFFTTKTREKGTGLGLAISYGIVKEHRGEISFETESGQFTRFYLDLPIDIGWDVEDFV